MRMSARLRPRNGGPENNVLTLNLEEPFVLFLCCAAGSPSRGGENSGRPLLRDVFALSYFLSGFLESWVLAHLLLALLLAAHHLLHVGVSHHLAAHHVHSRWGLLCWSLFLCHLNPHYFDERVERYEVAHRDGHVVRYLDFCHV